MLILTKIPPKAYFLLVEIKIDNHSRKIVHKK